MRFGVVVFPGSNCDLDAYHMVTDVMGEEAVYLWHGDRDLQGADLVLLPGGFSYGDYLRCGAIARFSPIMAAVKEFAARGGLVLGICNGFQILLESGLLPGALYRNDHLQFRCQFTHIRVEQAGLPFTGALKVGDLLKIPIAHGEGNYFAPPALLQELENGGQVVFRYVNEAGEVTPAANPNGSLRNIAGICSREGNVLGMMPHPERAGEKILGSDQGRGIFRSVIDYWRERKGAAV
jgi:phosphoribosylformylglycinamidine synthase subunit PurQ / glutaminase